MAKEVSDKTIEERMKDLPSEMQKQVTNTDLTKKGFMIIKVEKPIL